MSVSERLRTESEVQLPAVKRLRHRAEVPLLLLGTFLLGLALIVVVVMIVDGLSAPGWLRSLVVVAIVGPVLSSLVVARYMYWSRSPTPSR